MSVFVMLCVVAVISGFLGHTKGTWDREALSEVAVKHLEDAGRLLADAEANLRSAQASEDRSKALKVQTLAAQESAWQALERAATASAEALAHRNEALEALTLAATSLGEAQELRADAARLQAQTHQLLQAHQNLCEAA